MDTVKDRVVRSMDDLLGKMSLESMTVTSLCREAGISRVTFYNHFHDKFEVACWHFQQGFDSASQRYLDQGSWVGALSSFLEHEVGRKDLFRRCYCYTGQNNLGQYHYGRVFEFHRAYCQERKGSRLSEGELFSLGTYCHGNVCMIARWAEGGMAQPPETLARYLFESIPDTVVRYLR